MKNIINVPVLTLLILFTGFAVTACDDSEKAIVVPDNWVTLPAEPMKIDHEGGRLTCDFTLAEGLDGNVVYIINQENWCSGYINDGKIVVDVAVSWNINGRAAKMFLVYDKNHQVELAVEQGGAPPVLVETIDISAVPASININETLDLNTVVKVLPSNASYKNLVFTLEEGSEAFAELSEAGVITGIAGGEARINVATVDDSGVTEIITLNIIGNILLNRDSWTVSTSITYSNGNNYAKDGTTGNPEHLFDDKTTTYLSMVKPGKTYDGNTAGGINVPLYFVVDMGIQQTFNYFTWMHRSSNGYNYLRVWGVSLYGSNDGQSFTEINLNIDVPYDNNTDKFVIPVPESTYRYVKVQYVNWSDLNGTTSGSTLQVAEFGLGRKL